jgi:hypothetical protein
VALSSSIDRYLERKSIRSLEEGPVTESVLEALSFFAETNGSETPGCINQQTQAALKPQVRLRDL